MTVGVYKYTDLETGLIVYVGKDSHIDTNQRHRDHLNPNKYDQQPFNRILQNNPERYEYSVIWSTEDCTTLKLNKMEILFGKIYDPKFNFSKFGSGGCYSEESKRKISESKKGKTLTDEHKQKISINNGRYWKGKTFSDDHKQKIRESVKGENHPNAKYTLWDVGSVHYNKWTMFKDNREPDPCNCFTLAYNGKEVRIGRFIDPISPEIIKDLINEYTEEDD